jgi:hypothetical protein
MSETEVEPEVALENGKPEVALENGEPEGEVKEHGLLREEQQNVVVQPLLTGKI